MELNKRQISHLEKSSFFRGNLNTLIKQKGDESGRTCRIICERAAAGPPQIKPHGRVFVLRTCACLIRLNLHLEMKHLLGGGTGTEEALVNAGVPQRHLSEQSQSSSSCSLGISRNTNARYILKKLVLI